MPSDRQLELYRQHHTAQDKYTYFLLAVVGAAIGFAVNETHSMKMSMSQIPLALAIMFWGLSFYFGCKQLQYVRRVLWDNADLLKVEAGQHELVGRDPTLIKITAEFTKNHYSMVPNGRVFLIVCNSAFLLQESFSILDGTYLKCGYENNFRLAQ